MYIRLLYCKKEQEQVQYRHCDIFHGFRFVHTTEVHCHELDRNTAYIGAVL
jgi:hypothetical protein